MLEFMKPVLWTLEVEEEGRKGLVVGAFNTRKRIFSVSILLFTY